MIPLTSLSTRDLARLRLLTQRVQAPRGEPADVVAWMTAVQGQDLPGALWAIGLRSPGATREDVVAAFDAGSIVRSWPMRGTLHVVAAGDLLDVLSLTSARTLRVLDARATRLGVDAAVLASGEAAVLGALAVHGRRTRVQLRDDLARAGHDLTSQQALHVLQWLALRGLVCLGPFDGVEQAVVATDAWLPPHVVADPDEVLARVALRFVASHGPTDAADLARWTGLPLTAVRRALAACGLGVSAVEVQGRELLAATEALEALAGAAEGEGTHLLPGFDEFVLGYADRSFTVPTPHAERVVPGGNGMFLSTVVSDGQVVGLWSRTVRARDVLVDATPFEAFTARTEQGIEAAAQRYEQFLGRVVTVRRPGGRAGSRP